ncbi:MAG: aspartate carbamoyltransferase [Candidatus Levybacteria bacterium]|nr:aspartate carbamoyltransferase [Candidatus Levybacteria bacterium]
MPDITGLEKIHGNFKKKDILSLEQFSTDDIKLLFSHVEHMRDIAVNSQPSDILKGNVVTLLFYEPSSRTFGSFGAAIKHLGGQTIDIINPQQFSSVVKGETLEDTIRVFESYTDAIVIRHPEAGTAIHAAMAAKNVPIINAGDGIGEHPTQALLDLYTIYETFGRLDNLTILFTGDILNGRTVHSLMRGLALYPNNTIYLLAPTQLQLSSDEKKQFEEKGLTIHLITTEQDIPPADVWYWTRVQKERFENLEEYEKMKHAFVLTQKLLDEKGKQETIVMHPLPKVGEIEKTVDRDPRAIYLTEEIQNGLYVRMALMGLVLGKL